MNYTKEELTDMSATDIRIIADGLGLEYSTKTPTIERIIQYQLDNPSEGDSGGVTDTGVSSMDTGVNPNDDTGVNNDTTKVNSNDTTTNTSVCTNGCPMPQPKTYWSKLGVPVGNDGDKIRYRLDGTRIN